MYFSAIGQISSTNFTPEKRNKQGLIRDYLDFLSGGNFQASMQTKSSGFIEVRRWRREFRESETTGNFREQFGEERHKQSKNSKTQYRKLLESWLNINLHRLRMTFHKAKWQEQLPEEEPKSCQLKNALSSYKAFVVVQSLSCVQLFATPWTVAHQAPLSIGFPRQVYRIGCHFSLQGNFLIQGTHVSSIGRQILYH